MAKPRIDVIIFSPPFSSQIHNVSEKFASNHPNRPKSNYGVYIEAKYGADDNIGNLRYGKIEVEAPNYPE